MLINRVASLMRSSRAVAADARVHRLVIMSDNLMPRCGMGRAIGKKSNWSGPRKMLLRILATAVLVDVRSAWPRLLSRVDLLRCTGRSGSGIGSYMYWLGFLPHPGTRANRRD